MPFLHMEKSLLPLKSLIFEGRKVNYYLYDEAPLVSNQIGSNMTGTVQSNHYLQWSRFQPVSDIYRKSNLSGKHP